MPIDTSFTQCDAGIYNATNVDNSSITKNITHARNTKILHKGPLVVNNRSSVRSLHTSKVTSLEAAEEAIGKKMPRIKAGASNLMDCIQIKLQQTFYRLEMLQELGCQPSLYTAFEVQWEEYRDLHNDLKQKKPSAWNPLQSIQYLNDVCELKAAVKSLYSRCVTASQVTREKNSKYLSYQRHQKDAKRSPYSRGPEWLPILEKYWDSDDEDDEDDDEVDDDDGPTPRCATFGAGISS